MRLVCEDPDKLVEELGRTGDQVLSVERTPFEPPVALGSRSLLFDVSQMRIMGTA